MGNRNEVLGPLQNQKFLAYNFSFCSYCLLNSFTLCRSSIKAKRVFPSGLILKAVFYFILFLFSAAGFETTLAADLHFPDLKMGEQDTLSHPGTLRPDALLGSFWRHTESSQDTNEQSPLDDAMAMLPDEDLGDENRTMP